MTVNELINELDRFVVPTLIYFAGLPLFALLLGWICGENAIKSPWKFIYSVLIYAVCIPAIFSFILILYAILFVHTNLLDSSVLAYFLPIVSLLFTVAIINKTIKMDQIPGFQRLSGLVTVIILAFVATFLIQRVFIAFVFFGSIWSFIAIFLVLFIVFKFALKNVIKS